MIYEWSIAVAANTTKANRDRKNITLPQGVIHRVNVIFPTGCAGLAHLIVRDGVSNVYPTNSDDSFNSDNEIIDFRDFFKLPYKRNKLQIYTWNLDDTYAHTITLRLGVLPEEVLLPFKVWEALINSMKKLFGVRG